MPRNKYLLNEHPISVYPSLAKEFGLSASIFLQVLHNWFNTYENSQKEHVRHWQKGKWWAWGTPESWHENNIDFLSASTIKRAITTLRERKVVIVDRFNKVGYDRTNWYSIDYEVLDAIMEAAEKSKSAGSKRAEPLDQNGPMALGQNDLMADTNMTPTIPISSSSHSTNILGAAPEDSSVPDTVEHRVNDDSLEIQFRCTNPNCDEIIIIADLDKVGAECPYCSLPVRVRNESGKVIKKPSQKARRQEGKPSAPVSGFDDKPLRGFCILCNVPYNGLTPKKKKQWASQLKRVADENGVDSDVAYQAIKAIKDSEHGWKTFASPYATSFQETLTVMILRSLAGPSNAIEPKKVRDLPKSAVTFGSSPS